MTDNMLKSLVTEAVSLDREINEMTDRLKELKAELVAEALSREGELALTDSGGYYCNQRQRAVAGVVCLTVNGFDLKSVRFLELLVLKQGVERF
ncbi:MAG TPA: hypothetical protein VFH31_07280 [Pyrinomonadaceae bacterium]|nr:hypothetical protein [Pyrinomonadaceae bacterium]